MARSEGYVCMVLLPFSDPKHPDPSLEQDWWSKNPIPRIGLLRGNYFLRTYKRILRVNYWKTHQDVLGEISWQSWTHSHRLLNQQQVELYYPYPLNMCQKCKLHIGPPPRPRGGDALFWVWQSATISQHPNRNPNESKFYRVCFVVEVICTMFVPWIS